MAAVTAPGRTAAQHQSLLHFVGRAWSDEKVLAKAREMVQPMIERQAPIAAWIIDDTGFPKKGEHSVGVTRQYCASSASRTTVRSRCRCRLPIATRACRWPTVCICRKTGRAANGGARRACLRMSASNQPEIALEQVEAACKADLPRGVVLMDAGYAATPTCAPESRLRCAMWPASCRTPLCDIGTGRCRLKWSGQGVHRSSPPRRQASTDLGQAIGSRLAKACLAHDPVARGTPVAVLALCARTRSCRASRLQSHRQPPQWLLIEWPKARRANQVLALNASKRYHLPLTVISPSCAGASSATIRAQAEAAWHFDAMARLPSPRHAVHRRLRIPDLRAGIPPYLVPPRFPTSYPTITLPIPTHIPTHPPSP